MASKSLADTILTYEHIIDKQSRNFRETTEADELRIIDEQKNGNTTKKTKYDLKIFEEFLQTKGEHRQAIQIPPSELDKFLANYLISIRMDDKEYEPDTLSSKYNSIARHLRENGYEDDPKTSKKFDHSRRVLEAKRKQLKGQGKGNRTKKAQLMEDEELAILRKKELLGTDTARGLLNSIWMTLTQQFGLRSVTPQVNMLWGDVQLKVDHSGHEYLEYNERTTKTRTGKSTDARPFAPKAFANPEAVMCPVALYKAYRSHRPESSLKEDSRMFLQPLSRPKDNIWYSTVPMGKNSLSKIVKNMYTEAGLGGRHTNHSARRTMISTALQEGIHETKLMQISGHKNVQSLNEYRSLSLNQQKEISNLLSGHSGTTADAHPHDQHGQVVSRAPTSSCTVTSHDYFDDCEISDIDLLQADISTQQTVAPRHTTPYTLSFNPSNCTFNGPVVLKFN